MKYQFGKTSGSRLSEGHIDLITIFTESITYSPIDFSIVECERAFNRQLLLFLAEKSELDPRIPEQLAKAKHVVSEDRPQSEAVDIALYVPRKKLAYHEEGIILVAGHIIATAKRLYDQGITDHLIRWGGNWDGDEEVVTDQKFDDLVHFELMKP